MDEKLLVYSEQELNGLFELETKGFVDLAASQADPKQVVILVKNPQGATVQQFRTSKTLPDIQNQIGAWAKNQNVDLSPVQWNNVRITPQTEFQINDKNQLFYNPK